MINVRLLRTKYRNMCTMARTRYQAAIRLMQVISFFASIVYRGFVFGPDLMLWYSVML